MLLIWLRMAAMLLTVLGLGASLAHLYELPAKLSIDGALWLTLLQQLYPPLFGPLAGTAEGASVAAALLLCLLLRRRPAALRWTAAAALCLVAAHAVFWLLVAPVNTALLPLTPPTLPPDWEALRMQWELSHAARAALQLAGLLLLWWSVLRETLAQS
ncbi:DUF1772 domain-containing protein [Schlegelella sp. S2-27]|uniref:DUF1772 domain-containing protein n=1 Tax=Caldimonas mangrovi TaxID=2944811 RepID=A0ABT0YSY6_9BURK|nr:anthrone oxygenase family protein [Caldimonas mangrovi]MCM5681861.1 DUF1772 domain-containing protein [Caldimonas mangrovi]